VNRPNGFSRLRKQPECPGRVEIIPASEEQRQILANLLQLYAYDFSEFCDIEFEADGRFVYKDLPLYWREPHRHAFLVRTDNKLAGFALVKLGSEISGDPNVWDLVEFFVIRGLRRRGIGTKTAHEVWKKFPGRWEVRVLESNQTARQFWEWTIKRFVGKAVRPSRFEKEGDRWFAYAFESSSQ
jgi:predicted acetyltransferase